MTKSTVLIVQCCHLPQFFYVVDKLQHRHPEWELEALVCDHPHGRYYLESFPRFRKVHFLGEDLSELSNVDRIIFPLLNRGYWKIKKAAQSLFSPGWEVDYEGNLQPLQTGRLYLSLWTVLHAPCKDFTGYLRKFPLPPLGQQILCLKSCHASLLGKTEKELGRLIPKESQIMRVEKGPFRKIWSQARSESFDSAVIFFSGEKGFTFMKLVPFLLVLPRILIVNENAHFFYADVRSLYRFLVGRILYGVSSPNPQPRLLLVQTETPLYVSHAIGKLKEKKLFPRSEIILLCREADRSEFDSNSQIDQILTYSGGRLWNNFQLWKEIKKLDADMVCAIFSGRPYFKKAKLLFFFLPVRRHLVFNARLDCYDLSPRTFFWIFRKVPLLFETEEISHRVVLLQTEHRQDTRSALSVLSNPRIVPKARISVFCAEDSRNIFESLPEVEKVFTWNRHKLLKSLRAAWRMARFHPDVLAAIFSGRPVFRKQKLLFFLLPARHRLVFNENLDCFYLSWRTFHRFFIREAEGTGVPGTFLRKIVRVPLFLPRFAYLSMWATIMKLKRVALRTDHRSQITDHRP
ncbi:hypothetical protein MYX78_03230 [Acidobacteria bacterium AH-259-G07]|nr:hypothetical protein [Acidobacteria bacterium AH-259-G07]